MINKHLRIHYKFEWKIKFFVMSHHLGGD